MKIECFRRCWAINRFVNVIKILTWSRINFPWKLPNATLPSHQPEIVCFSVFFIETRWSKLIGNFVQLKQGETNSNKFLWRLHERQSPFSPQIKLNCSSLDTRKSHLNCQNFRNWKAKKTFMKNNSRFLPNVGLPSKTLLAEIIVPSLRCEWYVANTGVYCIAISAPGALNAYPTITVSATCCSNLLSLSSLTMCSVVDPSRIGVLLSKSHTDNGNSKRN